MRSNRQLGNNRRSRADRRNTMDCAILNQMIIEPSIGGDERARNDKRSIQLQREFERDQKMAIAHRTVPQRSSLNINNVELEATVMLQNASSNAEPKCIETSRFMSVKSRPIACRISAPSTSLIALTFPKVSTLETPQTRQEFHETFSNLIKLVFCFLRGFMLCFNSNCVLGVE
jgi:mitogen-activated protein kinase kinase kinase 4